MTPVHIHLLLHYYAIAEPVAEEYCNQKTVDEFTKDLKALDLIVEDFGGGSGYRASEKGKTFVKMLLATPLPVHAWIDPRTNGPV